MAFRLLPRKPNDHPARIRLQTQGGELRGWRSPALDIENGGRQLVLVSVKERSLPPEAARRIARLRGALNRLDDRAMASAKKAVVEIMDQRFDVPAVCVAVHKMGPVPAIALADEQIALHDGSMATVVGFPLSFEHAQGNYGEELPSIMLACLEAVDTRALLETYIEDVGQHLGDICDKLGVADGLIRVRHVSEILSQSILDKLERLTPSPDSWQRYRELSDDAALPASHDLAVCRWFDQGASLVAEMVTVLCAIRRLLKDYTDLVGLAILKDHEITIKRRSYSETNAQALLLERYPGTSATNDGDDDPSELFEGLARIMGAYHGNDIDAVPNFSGHLALEGIAEFAVTLLVARQELAAQFKALTMARHQRLAFVSHRLHSPLAKRTSEAIEAIGSRFPEMKVRPSKFVGQPMQRWVRARVRTKIWLSGFVCAVFPSQDDFAPGALDWIHAEIEHAVAIDKQLLLVAGNERERRMAIKDMRLIAVPPLSGRLYVTRDEARKRLLNRLDDSVAITSSEPGGLEQQLEVALTKLTPTLLTDRRRALLRGYLGFLTNRDRNVLAIWCYEFQGKSMSRADLEKAYAKRQRRRGEAGDAASWAKDMHNAFDGLRKRSSTYPLHLSEDRAAGAIEFLTYSRKNNAWQLGLTRMVRRLDGDNFGLDLHTIQGDILACLPRLDNSRTSASSAGPDGF